MVLQCVCQQMKLLRVIALTPQSVCLSVFFLSFFTHPHTHARTHTLFTHATQPLLVSSIWCDFLRPALALLRAHHVRWCIERCWFMLVCTWWKEGDFVKHEILSCLWKMWVTFESQILYVYWDQRLGVHQILLSLHKICHFLLWHHLKLFICRQGTI